MSPIKAINAGAPLILPYLPMIPLKTLSTDLVTRRDRVLGNGVNWLQSVSSFARVSGSIGRCGLKCLRDLRFLIAECHLEKGISI